jgi:hypothetical protein
MIDQQRNDTRLSSRGIGRSRAVALTATVILALGIGMSAAISRLA